MNVDIETYAYELVHRFVLFNIKIEMLYLSMLK